MDWLTGLKTAIDYMEEHLLEDISAEDVADAVYLSPFYFQKCFKILTGYSIGEYLRNRRLYLAALEVLKRNVPGEESRGRGSRTEEEFCSKGGGTEEESCGRGSRTEDETRSRGGVTGEEDRGRGSRTEEESDSRGGGTKEEDRGRGSRTEEESGSRGGGTKEESRGRGSRTEEESGSRVSRAREESRSRVRTGGSGERKVIDLAYKYGYDTPESFTRAFTRFHGLSPMQLRSQPHQIKVFLPLIVEISVKGGNRMEFKIEKREAMRMIGFERIFSFETSYQEIPKFWDEFCDKYCRKDAPREQIADENHYREEGIRQTIAECMVGEYGVCIEDMDDMEHFRYYIAGVYQGGEVPEGMKVFEIPASEWAKFKCTGAMPDTLQTVNTRIFKEWLPGNREYEMAFHLNIEWYSGGDTDSDTYESAIWIPVRRLG